MKVAFAIGLLVVISSSACKKQEGQQALSTEQYSFTATIDNNPVRWEVKAIDNRTDTSKYHTRAHYFYSQWPVDCATTDCYDVGAGIVFNERNRGNGIEVVHLQAQKTYDINALQVFFSPGQKTFGKQRSSSYTTTTNGIVVRYTENGRVWSTEKGDQSGSSFESVTLEDATTDKDRYSKVWRARFSCTVYFDGLPARKIHNAEIYGPAFYK